MNQIHQLYELLSNIKVKTDHKYKDVFDQIKKFLSQRINNFIDGMKKTPRGRKRIINFDQFLTCLFSITDCGFKMSYIKDFYNISKSTYYYYFDLLTKKSFFKNIYHELIVSYNDKYLMDYLITDTFTVKSMDGSDGLGRTCTDRGRKGLKVSLICDQNLVTHAIHLAPANIHDSKLFPQTVNDSITNLKDHICLADSGYAGSKYIDKIYQTTGITLLSKPKRTSNALRMSHIISQSNMELIKKKRNYIERLNGNIRKFRGLMIKYTKKSDSYSTYLYVAIICITCYNIIKLLNH